MLSKIRTTRLCILYMYTLLVHGECDKNNSLRQNSSLPRVVMRALLMQSCTRVARARCARGTRCWLARGDSSPRPSLRALHIRARAAGFHCSCHFLCQLPPPLSLPVPVLSLCQLSLRLSLSLCDFIGRASSLDFRVGFHLFFSPQPQLVQASASYI